MKSCPMGTTVSSTSDGRPADSSLNAFRVDAAVETQTRRAQERHARQGRVAKERRDRRDAMNKLKQLLPTVAGDQHMTKLELLQHVIDYICELQEQLLMDRENLSISSTAAPELARLTQMFNNSVSTSGSDDSSQHDNAAAVKQRAFR